MELRLGVGFENRGVNPALIQAMRGCFGGLACIRRGALQALDATLVEEVP